MGDRDFNKSEINQYYTDVHEDDTIEPSKYFNKKVYNKNFNVNDFRKYKSKEYYSWINQSFDKYSFPPGYSLQSFDQICNSVDYSLKPQQKFVARVFNTLVDTKGILVYHGLGSGKTQTSIVIGEAFKFRSVKKDEIIPGRTDSMVLIVVPAALVDQYYSEIIGNIENDTVKSASGQIVINGTRQFYLNKKLRNAVSKNKESIHSLQEEMNKGNLNSASINKIKEQILELEQLNKELYEHEKKKVHLVYEILSHETFLNRLFKNKNGTFIEGEYLSYLNKKNGLLIIDEAHGLVSAIGSNYRKLLLALRYYTDQLFKIVLLTGSPIYDKPFEFGLLMNLLRPRMLFPETFETFNEVFIENKKMINKDLFKQMCSGYVSYFKGGNPEAYPYKRVIIMNHQMDAYQYSVYKNALFKEVERDRDNKIESKEEFIVRVVTSESNNDEGATSVFNNSRLFCNIAFPGVGTDEAQLGMSHKEIVALGQSLYKGSKDLTTGEYYDLGVEEMLRINPPGRKNRQQIIEQGLTKFKKKIQSVPMDTVIKTVKQYSSKFAKVAEIIEQSDGPVFVYSNYVPYGVDSMAAVMDALGYSAYPRKGSKGSYFVWKGQADPSEIKRAYRAYNSVKNKDGSVLKIMFGTQSVMEGVDFKRVRQVHVLDPWWNDSRMQQVIARAIRLCSHRELPPEKRVVDVFIHLSTLGSGETLYELKINEEKDGKTTVSKIFSTLETVYLMEDKSKWRFHESYIKDDRVYNSKKTFKINQIVKDSIKKMADPELTKKFGRWKQLDSISVEQYMYNRALTKLDLNRQFELCIKESALDCDINKNGNIIRLEEHYLPQGDLFSLEYLNYSTGEVYEPMNKEFYSLETILNKPVLLDNGLIELKNKETKQVKQFLPSLIIPEDINCSPDAVYSFNKNIPESVYNLTINNQMIKFLKKINLQNIKKFFFDVEHGNVEVSDPTLPKKIKKFYSKQELDDRGQIIHTLQTIGVGVDNEVWDYYTTDELKKIASKIIKK
jgi:hypothetical protein